MLNETARKWVEALESKEWKQVTSALKMNGGYCCLGVLCEISGLGKWDHVELAPESIYMGQSTYLPDAVKDMAKLMDENGLFTITNEWWEGLPPSLQEAIAEPLSSGNRNPDHLRHECSLSTLNDYGVSFKDIAEVIKSNPPGLFWAP